LLTIGTIRSFAFALLLLSVFCLSVAPIIAWVTFGFIALFDCADCSHILFFVLATGANLLLALLFVISLSFIRCVAGPNATSSGTGSVGCSLTNSSSSCKEAVNTVQARTSRGCPAASRRRPLAHTELDSPSKSSRSTKNEA
jgi:hypothetical protein